MTDKEAADFLKKATLWISVPRKNTKTVTKLLYLEAMAKAIAALEERERMIGWLSKFCLHNDMADKHLSYKEAKVFWKKKMNEQFGWKEGDEE